MLMHENLLTMALGTLGAGVATSTPSKIDGARLQGVQLQKGWAEMSFKAKTTDNGPIVVGYAINLTNSEIAEFFNADPQLRNDPRASEEANSKVVPCWVIPKTGTATAPTPTPDSYTVRRIPVFSFKIVEGTALTWFSFNRDTAALDTGCVVALTALWMYKWLND